MNTSIRVVARVVALLLAAPGLDFNALSSRSSYYVPDL